MRWLSCYVVLILLAGLAVAGCASKPETILAANVSPVGYQAYSCAQLAEEGARVSKRTAEVVNIQREAAENDALMTGIALIVFTPAALLIQGNTTSAAELSRLKGELEAIELAGVAKNCGLQIIRMPATPPAPKSSMQPVAVRDASGG